MRLYLFLRFLRKKDTSYVIIISPIQSLSSTPGVFCRVPCDASHTRNTFRAADSLSDKGNLYDYVDRAWVIPFLYDLRAKVKKNNDLCKFLTSNRLIRYIFDTLSSLFKICSFLFINACR